MLGPLEARVDDRSIALGGMKQRGLLALLLLRPNEVVSRDRLIDELWRDHAPETAANALAALVARLRRVLPADVLVTRSGGYEVQVEPETVDVYRFERLLEDGSRALAAGDAAGAADHLHSALSLWRGRPLADFTYEPFAEPAILRLEELRLGALENRIDADLALGRHGDLVGELQPLVADHPLRERFRGQLMLALYRSGRQAEALEVYREGRRVLLDELGIDPSPALQDLEKAILRQDPVVSAPEPVLAELRAAATEASVGASGAPVAEGTRALADEVRPVTIVFADVVGSTALGERLAPEETKALVGECVTIMSHAVEEYGGTVQAYQGDGICAYFGVPAAHENDPERAALAALRILELMDEYTRDIDEAWGIEGFTVRIGINTGRAGVGLVGAADPRAVALGDATNVAARVQGAAEPGTILVGETTARRLTHRFVLEPLHEITVKGREEPVLVSRLVDLLRGSPFRRPRRASAASRRSRCSGPSSTIPRGSGRIVVLSGAAGIGKSRLVAELQSLAGENAHLARGRTVCPTEASRRGLHGDPPRSGSQPRPESRRSRSGRRLGRGSARSSARSSTTCSHPSASSCDPARSPLRARRGPTQSRRRYLRWLEALGAEQPVDPRARGHPVGGCPDARAGRGSAGADRSRAGLALVLTDEPIAGSEGGAVRLRALGDTRIARRSSRLGR